MLGGLLSSYDINGHDTEEACQFRETGKLQKKSKRLVQFTRNPLAKAGDILQLSYCKRLEISYLYTVGKTGIYFLYPEAKCWEHFTCG
jgi:hypothetical protein